jgi:hypothetical protein
VLEYALQEVGWRKAEASVDVRLKHHNLFIGRAGIAALGSTCHLEISLAAICPSCSKEDRVPSSRLQGSQLPPEVSGMADSMLDDTAELLAASDFVAWRGNSGSMAARGMAEMISKTSKEEEEDKASLWQESHQRRRNPAAAHWRSRSSRGSTEEREGVGGE